MLATCSIAPLAAGDSVGAIVAEAVEVVRASGLPNETSAMFTNVEGDWDEVMSVIKDCVMRIATAAPRVSVVMKLDYRPGATDQLTGKVESIERHLDSAST